MEESTPVTPPAPAPNPAPATAPAKPKSRTGLIIIIVILVLLIVCCGGTAIAWFVAKQKVINWAENLGINLEDLSDIDVSKLEDDSSDDDTVYKDGDPCVDENGYEGTWYEEPGECVSAEDIPFGQVTGTLMFPSEVYPTDLQVCAENIYLGVTECTDDFVIGARTGLYEYTLEVEGGDYYFYAFSASYDPSYYAYYSEFVECGMSVDCDDHTPIEVHVDPGDYVTGIDASDWYNF